MLALWFRLHRLLLLRRSPRRLCLHRLRLHLHVPAPSPPIRRSLLVLFSTAHLLTFPAHALPSTILAGPPAPSPPTLALRFRLHRLLLLRRSPRRLCLHLHVPAPSPPIRRSLPVRRTPPASSGPSGDLLQLSLAKAGDLLRLLSAASKALSPPAPSPPARSGSVSICRPLEGSVSTDLLRLASVLQHPLAAQRCSSPRAMQLPFPALSLGARWCQGGELPTTCLLYRLWVTVPCGRGPSRWFPWVGQPPQLGVSLLLGVLLGFVTSFGLSLLFASDGASGGARGVARAVTSSFWVQVPMPAVQQSPSSDENYMFFGSIRLPWPGPACPGARGLPFSVQVPHIYSTGDPPHQCPSAPSQLPPLLPSPRTPASPQCRSLACSLPRSPEVPCLPFPFAALRAGASRESTSGCPDQITLVDQSDLGDARSSALSLSAARPSAGDRPREVIVVARSCSTTACTVLASGVLAPPVSLSPSVSCALLFTLVTGPPMPTLAPRTSFAYLLWVSSVSMDRSCSSDMPSLHILLPRLSRGSPQNPAYLPLPPVSPALPHLPNVGSSSPALRSEFASTTAPWSSPAQLPGPSTRPEIGHSLPDGLPPVAPLLDVELGISLPDPLDALKVSLPPEQLDLLRSSFVAAVAPVSRSSLARLRRELRRIGASAASILPPGAARATRRRRFTWFSHEGCLLECAGLSARYRRRYLNSWICQHGPSVLIVVETKLPIISHACVRTLLRQPSFGFLPAVGAAGGILLAWSPPLTGVIVHVGRYSISVSLSGLWPNGPVLVTAVYDPCVGALHGQLWAELHQVRQLAASPWLLAGDFNCLLSPADSSSPVTFGLSMSAFRSFVDEFSLFDVPATNGTFIWSNNRNPPILRRLDRIFLSPELFSAFPSSSLVFWVRGTCLITPRCSFPFFGVGLVLGTSVDGRWAAFRLSRKLHLIKREAIAWKRFFWSGKFSKVAEWDDDILSLQASENISAVQSSRPLCLQGLTQEWRIRKSIHWQQRSRLGWLAHGDHNSRFFHLATSQRRRQTLLQSMNIGG
ncbi:hypothetical protein EJ110_NYTH11148 [Nymphaea thermarum]|nr:hypothetical protein EJ110_NYTH11148 [Nymphaea thermarum]